MFRVIMEIVQLSDQITLVFSYILFHKSKSLFMLPFEDDVCYCLRSNSITD